MAYDSEGKVLPDNPDTLLADIETTRITYDECGRMITPKTVHCLPVCDYETGEYYFFGPPDSDPYEEIKGVQFRNTRHDEIERGVRFLETAKRVVFHNGRHFDEIVLKENFGFDTRKVNCQDSLVLLKLLWSDVKESEDFKHWRTDMKLPADDPLKFTGDLINRHSLEAWGLRLSPKMKKGTYSQDMKARGFEDEWAVFNNEMKVYAIRDVKLLYRIWKERIVDNLRKEFGNSIAIEHWAQDLAYQMENTGIKFDQPHCERLTAELQARAAELEVIIQKEFPPRFEPQAWAFEPALENYYTALMMKFPTNKVYRPQFGIARKEDGGPWEYSGYTREMWGQVSYPKVRRTVKSKDKSVPTYEVLPYVPSIDEDGALVLPFEKPKKAKAVKPEDVPEAPAEQAEVIEDAPKTKKPTMSPAGFPERYMGENAFVKCHWAEFNPKSRPQIIRRLLEMGWVPDEFTDSGNPVTDDPQLTKMDEEFPGTKTLATYLMVQKRLGQISQGEKAWSKLCAPDGFIYPRHHMNATVTFRGAHSDPNISQVPSVRKHKVTQEPLRGEPGKWGYDCRQCFTVPPGFLQVGVDLSGIELRMWAHYLWPYDNGKLAYQILNEDIHENNRVLLGLADRRKAKEWLFAMIYGAGPEQLGFIISPTSSVADQIELGHKTRARFMNGVEGFDMLLEQLRVDARRGYCRALDGRRVPVRKAHAALNSLLQSAGTGILSKYWMMLALQEIEGKHGLRWGYDKDFVLMIYSHDETQWAVKEEYADLVKQACLDAAPAAGRLLKVKLPIAAEAHVGKNWAECH